MAVRKQCKAKGCKASPRCEHPWWFDVMHQGQRYRIPVDTFALARGRSSRSRRSRRPKKLWEPKFIGEIVAGKDPRKAPAPPAQAGLTVATFLDSYYTRLRRRRVASECGVDSQPPGGVEGCSRLVASLGT